MDHSFWRGRKVFITGHTGFKGSWLSLWLQQMGAVVTGYALEPTGSRSLFRVAQVADGMNSVVADVRNAKLLAREIEAARPEVVFHLAAQALVRRSYIDPLETYSTNVMGTVNLLEAVRKCASVRAVVNVTSDKCYDNKEWAWGYREADVLGGYDPYSSSKACAELVTAAYRTSYFHPQDYEKHHVGIATARAGNVIGGGDWAEARLIPDILTAFDGNVPAVIRNPNAIRPWQHVLEPIGGYLLLAQKLAEQGQDYAEAWNFGPGDDDAKPVEWIVNQMSELWGAGASWISDTAPGPHEARHLKLDCSKARTRLDWRPRWGLSEALRQIVGWQRAFLANLDMRQVTLGQIEEFTGMGGK